MMPFSFERSARAMRSLKTKKSARFARGFFYNSAKNSSLLVSSVHFLAPLANDALWSLFGYTDAAFTCGVSCVLSLDQTKGAFLRLVRMRNMNTQRALRAHLKQ